MKIYVAGPFFNDEQIASLESVENILIKNNFKMFRPRYDAGSLSKNVTKKEMQEVFTADVKAIDSCSMLLADITYRDTGTSFEIGYAFAKRIPVMLFCNTTTGSKMNLMLAASCLKNFTSLEDLETFFNAANIVYNQFEDVKGDIE